MRPSRYYPLASVSPSRPYEEERRHTTGLSACHSSGSVHDRRRSFESHRRRRTIRMKNEWNSHFCVFHVFRRCFQRRILRDWHPFQNFSPVIQQSYLAVVYLWAGSALKRVWGETRQVRQTSRISKLKIKKKKSLKTHVGGK